MAMNFTDLVVTNTPISGGWEHSISIKVDNPDGISVLTEALKLVEENQLLNKKEKMEFEVGKYYKLKNQKNGVSFMKVVRLDGRYARCVGFYQNEFITQADYGVYTSYSNEWEEMKIPERGDMVKIGNNKEPNEFLVFEPTLQEPYVFKSMKMDRGVFNIGVDKINSRNLLFKNSVGEEFFDSELEETVWFFREDSQSVAEALLKHIDSGEYGSNKFCTEIFKSKKSLFQHLLNQEE